MASVPAFLDRYFKISERQSTLGREVRGGLVTFFTVAYIVVLNPIILGGDRNADEAGNVLSVEQVAAVTALAAGVMCILFGLVANYPFAFAAGLGINALLAATIAKGGITWPQIMGLVVIDGIIIVILAATGLRTAVFNAIPGELKAAIAAGIGAFIAFIGFVDAGFVRKTPEAAGTVPVELGDNNSVTTWPVVIFIFGVLVMGVLVARKIRGGLLIGIVLTTILAMIVQAFADLGAASKDNKSGWSLNIPEIPSSVGGLPDLSLVGNVDLFGAFSSIGITAATMLVFVLVLSNFFDAMGTMTGLAKESGLADKDGNLPGIGKALVVEGSGAIVGGSFSGSSNTVFVESASGIAEGARTGLANIVTGLLFLVAMFFTPIYQVVPLEAAAPALVVVGALMISQVRFIDFTRFEVALPAFLTIVAMPFTYSIANGIGIGFIAWTVIAVSQGKWRSVHPLMYGVSVLFVIYFAKGPLDAVMH